MSENEIATIVVDIAYRIHTNLGPGLLESVYEEIFVHEIRNEGLTFRRQVEVPVKYDGVEFGNGFRLDLLINESVIVELKSVEQVLPVHKKQLLTYLKLTDKRLGFLINFNEALIKNGITRVVNGLH